jgi:hypothetical protein
VQGRRQQPRRPHHQVRLGLDRQPLDAAEDRLGRLDAQVVAQADGVHQAEQVVVAIRPPPEHFERQVDLGVAAVQH